MHTSNGYQEFLKEEGEKIENASYLKLEKTLYGLVQAAREWWKTYIDILKKNMGFKQFQNDNRLLKRVTDKGFCAMGIYVDDCILIGDERAIEEAINDVKKHFNITTEEVQDFIGCLIEKCDDRVLLNQPDLIRRLLKTFKDDIKDMKDYETPAGSGFKITRLTKEEELLNKEEQKKY